MYQLSPDASAADAVLQRLNPQGATRGWQIAEPTHHPDAVMVHKLPCAPVPLGNGRKGMNFKLCILHPELNIIH